MRIEQGKVQFSRNESILIVITLVLGCFLAFFTWGFALIVSLSLILGYYLIGKYLLIHGEQLLRAVNDELRVLKTELARWQPLENYLPKRIKSEYESKTHKFLALAHKLPRRKAPLQEECNTFAGEFLTFLDRYKNSYLSYQTELHSDFFQGREYHSGRPLNNRQILAVLTNDFHNLVVAGPGAGKTQVITSRAAFYVTKKGVPRDKILILAFNNHAAKEVRERLERVFDISDMQVSTFHAIGNQIIRSASPERPNIESNSQKRIGDLLKSELLTNPAFERSYLEYIRDFMTDAPFLEPPEVTEEMFQQRAGEKYIALDGTHVKSIAERDIANFFIKHGITYQYEAQATWVDRDPTDPSRTYHPDFYLPDWDIYLEHWALDNSDTAELPSFFEGGAEQYRTERDWKRTQFQIHQKTLWETYFSNFKAGRLEQKLRDFFASIEVTPVPLSHQELLAHLHLGPKRSTILGKDIAQTIITAKTLNYSFEKLHAYLSSIKQAGGDFPLYAESFYDLVLPIFLAYERDLANHHMIDFPDMINLATTLLREQRDLLVPDFAYQMIFVDEFQDVSLQRVELLQGLVKLHPDCRLFCVGDDWQAIYGFTGATTKYMVDFSRYFPDPERVDLELNYRNYPDVLRLGEQIIHNCHVKLAKTLESVKINEPLPEPTDDMQSPHVEFVRIQAVTERDFRETQTQQAAQIIRRLIETGTDPAEIMVLSRFKFGYATLRDALEPDEDLPEETERAGITITQGIRISSIHKSKGLEAEHIFLLNTYSGLFGFPHQIPSSFSLRLLSPDIVDILDEERRLFFVAVTRAKQHVHIFTWVNNDSEFLIENPTYLARYRDVLSTTILTGPLLQDARDYVRIQVESVPDHPVAVPFEVDIPRLMLYSRYEPVLGRRQQFYVSKIWFQRVDLERTHPIEQTPPLSSAPLPYPVPSIICPASPRSYARQFAPLLNITPNPPPNASTPSSFIMRCTHSTLRECLQRNLFGMPASLQNYYSNVRSGDLAFLFNTSRDQLLGVFKATTPMDVNLEPAAWGGRFPVQVRVSPASNLRAISNMTMHWSECNIAVLNRHPPPIPRQGCFATNTTRRLLRLFGEGAVP